MVGVDLYRRQFVSERTNVIAQIPVQDFPLLGQVRQCELNAFCLRNILAARAGNLQPLKNAQAFQRGEINRRNQERLFQNLYVVIDQRYQRDGADEAFTSTKNALVIVV